MSGSSRLIKNFPRTLKAHLADLPKGKPVEIWWQDEARIGQSEQDKKSIQWIDFPANGIVRQWAKRGARPRQPADQRYKNAALALPFADTDAMQLHIDEISRHVARGAHAVLLMDRAGGAPPQS